MYDKVIAFSDMFDIYISIGKELEHIVVRKIPVKLFMSSKSLFNVNSKGSRTLEKRMMLDIAASRK